jgi:hypothetical protein
MPKHEELYFTPHIDSPHQKWSILEDPECPSAGTVRRHYRQPGEKPDVKQSFGISEASSVLEYYAARAGIEYSRVSLGRQTHSFDLVLALLRFPCGMVTFGEESWYPVIPWVRDDGFRPPRADVMWRADFASFRQNEWVFAPILGSFWVRFPTLSCVFNNILASFVLFLCFSRDAPSFRGRIASVPFRISRRDPPARMRAWESSLFGFNLCISRSNLASFWVRFELVFQPLLVFSITYWLRSYYFVFFPEPYLPARSLGSRAGKSTSREVQEWPTVSQAPTRKMGSAVGFPTPGLFDSSTSRLHLEAETTGRNAKTKEDA